MVAARLVVLARRWRRDEGDPRIAAVRAVWSAFGRPRWSALADAARAKGLAPARAVVLDPRGRFGDLPRHTFTEMREPEDVGGAPPGGVLRSRSTALVTAVVVLWLLLEFWGRLSSGRSLLDARTVGVTAVFGGLWWLEVFRPARRRWGFSSDQVLVAPSIVVVRGPRRSVAFTPADSTLVVQRERRGLADSRVTIARDDGERVALRFGGPGDPRLRAVWTMWLHERTSRWDAEGEAIVPDRAG